MSYILAGWFICAVIVLFLCVKKNIGSDIKDPITFYIVLAILSPLVIIASIIDAFCYEID